MPNPNHLKSAASYFAGLRETLSQLGLKDRIRFVRLTDEIASPMRQAHSGISSHSPSLTRSGTGWLRLRRPCTRRYSRTVSL